MKTNGYLFCLFVFVFSCFMLLCFSDGVCLLVGFFTLHFFKVQFSFLFSAQTFTMFNKILSHNNFLVFFPVRFVHKARDSFTPVSYHGFQLLLGALGFSESWVSSCFRSSLHLESGDSIASQHQ